MTPADALAEVEHWRRIVGVPSAEAVEALRDALERVRPPHDECPLWAGEDEHGD